jgi:hypothetical protein
MAACIMDGPDVKPLWKRHVENPRKGIDKWYLCFCTDVPNEPQFIDINAREILLLD